MGGQYIQDMFPCFRFTLDFVIIFIALSVLLIFFFADVADNGV